MSDPQEIAKWREAHPHIYVPEEGLATVAPFPSLYATDFAAYLEARDADPQIVSFVHAITRETAWAYGNWQKAQRDAKSSALIDDMLNNATSAAGDGVNVDYSQVRRFLTDYARANGILLRSDAAASPPWMNAFSAPVVPQGAGTETVV